MAFGTIDYVSFLESLDADRAWNIVDDLAGDLFQGRRAGTHGADLASEYIAGYFDSIGLKPAGSGRTYRSGFTMPLWELAGMPRLTLVDESDNVLQTFEYRKDFNVVPGSGEGDYSAEMVFGGYGITAKELGYDDYAGVSARGKIVMVIVGTPASDKFKEGNYDLPYAKAENALTHGAVGLILVDSPANPTLKYIERARCGCCWTTYRKLTMLGGSVQFADALLKGSNSTLSSIQATINEEPTPQSFALDKRLHASVRVSFNDRASSYNVLGYISGSDPVVSKAVIVGAHYDHWGKDVDGSIFRGANDDASGVAVVMEIARALSTGAKPRWSLMFAAWSGEEEGYHGSHAYAEQPYFPLEGTIAYLNLDMVGYGQPLLGEVSEPHTALRTAMIESAEQLNISLRITGNNGGSDHVTFEERGVANAMFIYWPDDFYHTPADTSNHVSKTNLLETAKLTTLIALRLSEATIMEATLTASSTARGSTGTWPQLVAEVVTIRVLVILGAACMAVAVTGLLYMRRRKK